MLGISNRNGVRLRFSLVCLLFVGVTVFCSLVSSHSVFAAAKQSTITVNMTQGILDISLLLILMVGLVNLQTQQSTLTLIIILVIP